MKNVVKTKKKAIILILITVLLVGLSVIFYLYSESKSLANIKFKDSFKVYIDEVIKAEDYLVDKTIKNVDISFENKIDTSIEGEFENTIIAKKSFIFERSVKVKYIVEYNDITPPVIEGMIDKIVYLGEEVNYFEGVTVSDDYVKEPILEVDDSLVNINEIGEYEVVYKASDGVNDTIVKIKVTVRKKPTKIVYLTFDDGPSAYTLELLKILKENNVKATFFVTGNGNNNIFKNIYDEGHQLALHTFTHQWSIYSSVDSYFADINKLEKAIEEVIGKKPPKLIRFAGGSSNTVSRNYSMGIMSTLVKEVHNRGYKYYDWNCSTGDGGSNVTVQGEIDNVKSCLSYSNLMILAHDTKKETIEAMKTIIPMLLNNGYSFEIITPNTKEITHKLNN